MKRLTLGFRFVTMFKPDNNITIRCFIDTHYIHISVNINIIGPTVNQPCYELICVYGKGYDRVNAMK